MSDDKLYAEGNHGGDYVEIIKTPVEGVLQITIGHCCVHHLRGVLIPVEFLTTLLSKFDTPESIEKFMRDEWEVGDAADKFMSKVKDHEILSRTYTAMELAGDWWWDENYECVVDGGTTAYECATLSKTGNTVRLTRIDPTKDAWDAIWHPITRYVHPNRSMRLVLKEKA